MKFLLTDEHIKLLTAMRFRPVKADGGMPVLETAPAVKTGLDTSESFGNPDAYKGMEHILGLDLEDPMTTSRRFLLDFYLAELPVALSIVLRNGHFASGAYPITEIESLHLKAALNQALIRPVLDRLQADKSISINGMKVIRSLSEWLISDDPLCEFASKLEQSRFDESVVCMVRNAKDETGDMGLSRTNLRD